ncbi:MAG: decarboxylase [Alphaproteobacteria bacterium]|jgi:sulfopyruvate decarboxylase subunit alpha|nr:decarboxylase [Alphaproteobacteria bacterium]
MAALEGPRGADIIDALKEAGVFHVAALPDITTSAGLLWPLSKDTDFTFIRLSKEDEGVSICAALGYCEKRAVLLMQQTGLMDSLNNIRAVGCEYGQPVCMIVGLLGKEPDKAPTESASIGVRIIEPILDAMGIDRILIEGPEDVAKLPPAIDRAYATSRPMVALIGRRVEA